MKQPDIRTQIYALPGIGCRLRHTPWGYLTVGIGALCGVAGWLLAERAPLLSQLLVGMGAIGGLTLLVLVLYWLVGDSRRPYHAASHSLLEPEWAYYPATARQALCQALEARDDEALALAKRSTTPQLVIIRYRNDSHTLSVCQLMENTPDGMKPITEMTVIGPTTHNL